MEHITDQIEAALRRIRIGEPEAAVWRLAEAAGQLAEELKDKYPDQIGYDKPTGRGYRVVREPGCHSIVASVVLKGSEDTEYEIEAATEAEEAG